MKSGTKALFILLALITGAAEAATVTFLTSGNWQAPIGVTSVTVEAWGGGGAGGGATGNAAKGGGGAGGQYSSSVVTVVPGNTYAIVVGTGGTGSSASGTAGGDSTFAASVVVAKGGAGGAVGVIAGTGNGGIGSSTNGIGTTIFAGGNGSNGLSAGTGGAGGGGAGSGGAGGIASGNVAGSGTATGGGAGAAARTTAGTCNTAPTVAGGGGCGGYSTNNTARSGGVGAAGMLTVTYTAPPSVTTNAASLLSVSGATLNGTVTSNDASTTVTFEYGTTISYGNTAIAAQSPIAAGAPATAVSAAVIGLQCATQYHFHVVGVSSIGTTNGNDLTFNTTACPTTPTVATNAVTGVGSSGATLNGTVSSNGGSTIVTFEYGLTTSYSSIVTATGSPLAANASNTAVTSILTGLPCGMTYHFRVKGANSVGSATGVDRTFSTTVCPLPTVTTVAATSLTTTGGMLNGTVNDNGSITTVTFNYGLSTAYGSTVTANLSPVGPGWGALSVSAGVSGLNCNTTYHYRVSGVNTTGSINGTDMSFATAACPTVAAVSVTASPTVCINDPSIGTLAWTSFAALASDNIYASRSLGNNQQSNFLKCTGYGFAIPTGSTINGISVNLERSATGTNSPLHDLAMRLVKNGVIGTTDRSTTTTYPTTDTSEVHGSAVDLWGTTWTVADINNTNFGAALAVQKFGTTGGTFTANVDYMPITVNYTPTYPTVASINLTSTNPTSVNTSVSWDVLFTANVTGVDITDFVLVSSVGVVGATITSVTGSGAVWTVTANTGTGTAGTLALKLVDDDTIVNASTIPLGGLGAGNGNFTGQFYTLIVKVCTSGLLFCDDFERTNGVGGSNTANALGIAPGFGLWTVSPLGAACAGVTGNVGCAGIDSDVPPWSTASSPRANATRAMFTRWSNVIVTSPIIDLSTKTGAKLSFWLRRGSDCFSEWPGNNQAGCNATLAPYTSTSGEEFQVQYLNNLGTWIVLKQYPTDATPGEIFNNAKNAIGLPDDALWSGFQFRFVQPGGSGSNSTNGGAAGVQGYDYWHVDDVTLEEVPLISISGPFCDTFEGDLSRWDLAGTGDVNIGTTYRENGAQDMDLRWNTVSATTKSTDLSTNSGNNIISYWVKRGTGTVTNVPNLTGSDYPETIAKGLKFEYLNSAGTWKQLGSTFPGATLDGEVFLPTAVNNHFTIPADAKHAKFKLRITMLSGSGVYDQDYWHVDDVCVGTTVGSTNLSMSMTSGGSFSPGQFVNYTMVATNTGANADPGPIAIIDTLPVGLSFAGGSAGWSCSANGQVVTCTQNGGLVQGASTTLTLTASIGASASGTVTNIATVTGQANDSASASKTDTIFVPGYVFTDKACSLDGVAVDAGSQCGSIVWSPQTAGKPIGNVYITSINAARVPTQLNATTPTTVNMQFGLSCINPIADAGIQATFFDTSSTTTLPLCTANSAIPTSWSTSRALIFPAATTSVGPFSFNYDDVGIINLFMRNSLLTSQMGQSNSFVVKPVGFVISAIKCSLANTTNCGVDALAMPTPGDNPAAVSAAGGAFIRAGLPFSVTVTSVNANGIATPNYGKEVTPESVKLTPNNLMGTMVTPPSITCADSTNSVICDLPPVSVTPIPKFGAFNNGVATGTNFAWAEVGIIRLTPSVRSGSYLGGGDVTGTTSGDVGRFYPDHFDTAVIQDASNSVPMSCPTNLPTGLSCPILFNGFVYSGQKFSVMVTAKSAINNSTTQNYDNTIGFAKTANLSAVGAPGTNNAVSGVGTLGVPSVSSFAVGSLTEPAEKYTFTTPPIAPTNIYIRTSDADGASSLRSTNPTTTSVEGGVMVVSGRIKVSNAYGSELLPLKLMATAQYYTSTGWLNSLTDNVTKLTSINTSYSVGGGASAVTLNPTTRILSLGNLTIRLGPPGPGKTGVVLVTPSIDPLTPGNPNLSIIGGTATFGVYNSNNGYIYRRENY